MLHYQSIFFAQNNKNDQQENISWFIRDNKKKISNYSFTGNILRTIMWKTPQECDIFSGCVWLLLLFSVLYSLLLGLKSILFVMYLGMILCIRPMYVFLHMFSFRLEKGLLSRLIHNLNQQKSEYITSVHLSIQCDIFYRDNILNALEFIIMTTAHYT